MSRHSEAGFRETWLRDRIQGVVRDVRAPQGFTEHVMNRVYREAMAPTAGPVPAPLPPSVLRWYRRIGLSFMLTAFVLAVSLLVPPAAYPALLGRAAPGAALGPGPSAAVKGVLDGAGATVQAALGERLIGGGEQ